MNKVLFFDLLFSQAIGGTNFHGGGEYIKSVFYGLSKEYDGSYDLIVCYDTERFLDSWILEIIREKSINVCHVKTAEDIVKLIVDACSHDPKDKEVRFFAGLAYPYVNCTLPDSVISIGVCHGLRTLEKPYDRYAYLYVQSKSDIKELIKYVILKTRTTKKNRKVYENILKLFDVVITDSNHSAYSMKVNYPMQSQKREIIVFYPPEKHIETVNETSSDGNGHYILMISANRWIKNSYRGVKALDNLYEKGLLNGIKTRVYGNLPGRIKKGIKNTECFEFFGYVNSEELELAYKNCDLFFYPSLNEGFGLPPMEAMKYGKTCVISSICSLPELYGDAVYYCNPYDIQEMENRLLMALENPIPSELLINQVERIRLKQEADLKAVCNMLASE